MVIDEAIVYRVDHDGYLVQGKLKEYNSSTKKTKEDTMSEVLAPMPGTILEVLVDVGDDVSGDDDVVILEAMKMENPIVAGDDGKVKEIKVKEGDKVDTNQVLMVLE